MTNQEKLLKEIKTLSDSIRQKNRALKLGLSEREKFLETTFKPITDPLNKLSKNIKKPFEGDVILPISKYEEFKDEDRQIQSTEESVKSEEESEALRLKTEFSTVEGESEVSRGKPEFYTTEEETTNPSNLSKLGSDIVFKGPLARKYVLKMLHSTHGTRKYHSYGARLEDNGLMIGDTKLDVDDNDNIIVGDKIYKGTEGLYELIFKSIPENYTNTDMLLFKNILEETNAHRKKYSKDLPIYRNGSLKFTNIISTLFPSKLKKALKRRAMSSAELNVLHKKRRNIEATSTGKGLWKNLQNTNIIYYNDINKLVNRMRLLHEAMEAGHTGLENEWVALIDELRKRGIIA